MTEDAAPAVKPQSEVLYLLGGLNAKMDAVLLAQSSHETRLAAAERVIATLQAQQTPRAPWWNIVGGLAGIGALITVTIQLFATK